MDVKVEKLEKSMAKITVTLEPEKVDEAIVKAYHKVKNQISMPGFRKGKVPQKMIEKTYGAEVFYEDAANFMINESYPEAYDEASKEVEITSQPSVEDMDIEKGKAFTYIVTVATKPEVTLGEYKGIEYTKTDVTVTDEEVTVENTDNGEVELTIENTEQTVITPAEGEQEGEEQHSGNTEQTVNTSSENEKEDEEELSIDNTEQVVEAYTINNDAENNDQPEAKPTEVKSDAESAEKEDALLLNNDEENK